MANLSRAVLTGLGVLVAVIVLSPVTVVAMVALVAPVGIVIGQRTRIEHEFVRGRSLPERLKSAYVWRLSGKEGASDSRAYALTGEMRRRVTTLQHEIIDMKRVARRKQARLVFLSNAGGIVIVGMTIALLAWSYDRGHLSVPATVVLLTGVLRIQGIVGFAGFSVGLLHEGALFLHDVIAFGDLVATTTTPWNLLQRRQAQRPSFATFPTDARHCSIPDSRTAPIFRAGSGSASPSPAPSFETHRSSFSTNLPLRSMRGPSTKSSKRCAVSPKGGLFCSSPTDSRPCEWPMRLLCSTLAAS